MQDKEGVFIVIEGTDGSGKGTQFKLLMERLELAGYEVATFDFPRYDEPSSYFVKEYLNGKYGSADEVGPYTASLFYALDRYEAGPQIRQALKEGKVVLANRFTGSNMAHQGTKFRHADERRGYFIWLDNLEFEMLHIPRPNLNLVLRVPAEIAQTLVDKKEQRSYTDKKRDIHEADLSHLQRAVDVYDDLCQLFPKDFLRIDCVRNEQLLPIETVSNLVWEKVFPFLPKPTRQRKTVKAEAASNSEVLTTKNPYTEKTDTGTVVTDAGKEQLESIVTNLEESVYAFTDTVSPVNIANAVARFGAHSDDTRLAILEAFANGLNSYENLAEYDSDTMRQFTGIHFVVEGASNLLTKEIERGRLATYIEPAAQYSYLDQKDTNGQYKYTTPQYFTNDLKAEYRRHMDRIFDLYATMVRQLIHYIRENSSTPKNEQDNAWRAATRAEACEVLRAALPVAAKSTVGVFASSTALEQLIVRLGSSQLPEAQVIGAQILEQARRVMPTMLKEAGTPELDAAIAYKTETARHMQQLATEYLPEQHADINQKTVDLVDIYPRNELQVAADMLYEHSNLPLRELQAITEDWSYDKKIAVFSAYLGKRSSQIDHPGRVLEKIHYSWDIVSDYKTARELQRYQIVEGMESQQLTPRFGYDVPELVEAAGLSDLFEACFDTSLALYSVLQQAGYAIEAQYATLLGHKMHSKVTYNAREAFHLNEASGSPGYRKIMQLMYEKIAEAHPMIAEAMRFADY